MEENKPPLINMISLKSKIYIDVESLDKLYDYLMKGVLEISDEEKMEKEFSEDFIEGAASSYDLLKKQLQAQAQTFAVETELDTLGLGSGKTQSFNIEENKP